MNGKEEDSKDYGVMRADFSKLYAEQEKDKESTAEFVGVLAIIFIPVIIMVGILY